MFGSGWQVQLLGGLLLRNGDVEIHRFSSRQAVLLFARLALAPRAAWQRDDLARALWPELCPGGRVSDAARGRLRRTLSTLRVQLEQPGVVPASAFEADRDTVRLNAGGFDVDVERFQRHAARRDFAAARACYRGELLPGVHDSFVDEERDRLAARLSWVDAELAGASSETPEPEADDEADAVADTGARRPIVPYLTRFFGRRTEIQQLCRAVESQRVVTLAGPGGCGKTRLAAEAALEVAGFELLLFVALGDCLRVEQLFDHVRAALGVTPSGRPAIEQVAVRLAGQRVLLVLDNFEQLVGDAATAVLDSLLERLPDAHLLLTSRRRLGRTDETVIELAPLPLPAAGDDGDVDALARNAGVALFADRARAARSDFHISGLNAGVVADICRRLDGLPLAIELAAAKIRSHTPPEMLKQLQASLAGLARSSVRAARAGRHASLDAALAWSWQLLDPAARELLRALTAFRGGWTLEQACAVGGGAAVPALLEALARDSLVQAAPVQGGAPRFQMLGVVREFVLSRLSAPEIAAARARHRAHFLAHARALDARHAWPLAADLPNMAEALGSGVDDGDVASAAALMQALAAHWRARGAPDDLVELLRRVAHGPGLPAPQRVELLLLLAALWLNIGRSKDAHAEVVHALDAAAGTPLLHAQAVLAQAMIHWRAAHDGARALELLGQSEAQLLAPGAPAALRGRWLLLRGAVALEHEDDTAAAASRFEEAERVFRALGDGRTSLLALPGRAACLLLQQRFREAAAMAAAGEDLADRLGDVVTQAQLLNRLANAHEGLGQFEPALAATQREVRLTHQHGSRYFLAFALWNQPQALLRLRRFDEAAQLMAFARVYWLRQSPALSADDEAHVLNLRRSVELELGAARCNALWERGAALSDRAAIALASGEGLGREPQRRARRA